jgi:hypothetical protein
VPSRPTERTPESEALARRLAFGLFCLDAPLWWEPVTRWAKLQEDDELRFDLYVAKARFLSAMSELHPASERETQ